jgi:anti-anti-sigma regulatory factor
MASNFGISVYRNNKILQLKLSGDFDGSSALQLLSLMRNCLKETDKIFIHTDSIRHIEPFGLNMFRYNLGSLVKHPIKFVFTGENALSLIKTWPDNGRPELKSEKRKSLNKTVENHLFY